MNDDPNVLDEHGNNAAVRCPSCAKVFVFSRHINKQNGRQCPHCLRSRAVVKDGVVTVEAIEPQHD
jgi:NAD-dependent SIR2 family protein deacetylase